MEITCERKTRYLQQSCKEKPVKNRLTFNLCKCFFELDGK